LTNQNQWRPAAGDSERDHERSAPRIAFANRRYSAALRTATNTRSRERLARVRATIERDHRAGTIGDEEAAAYREIIQLADRNAWEEAERRVVDFREDQRPKGWW
jgi:hypothetical protein